MWKQSKQDRQDQIVREALARLKGKVNYNALYIWLYRHRTFFVTELDPFFTKKLVPLLIRDLDTSDIPIQCHVMIRNTNKEIPEGIIHFTPQTLGDLICIWLEATLKVSMSTNVANGANPQTHQRATRFWRFYLYRNMNALLREFSRCS